MARNLCIVWIAVLCSVLASHVRADTRVTVHDFYGPNATRLRDDVVTLLERQSGVTIVSRGQVERAAEKLGLDSFSPDGRQVLARELKLSAWMSGMVQRRRGELTLTVVVHDGAQHARVGRVQLIGSTVNSLRAKIRGSLWKRSSRAIMRAAAPEPKSDQQLAKQTDVAPDMVVTQAEADGNRTASSATSEREADVREAVRVYIGVGSPYRNLVYNQPVSPALGDYQLSGAMITDISLSFHPARLLTDGWASWLGVDARAQLTLSSPTLDHAGSRFKSRYDAFHVGLRARVPIGRHYVSAFSGYALSRFALLPEDELERAASPAPGVDYRSIRSGIGVDVALTDALMLGAEAAWLAFLSVGEIGAWFPRASAGGVDLAMLATYRVNALFFARAAATYQRTFFDFNSRPGDDNVAGGATDQLFALSLGAGVSL